MWKRLSSFSEEEKGEATDAKKQSERIRNAGQEEKGEAASKDRKPPVDEKQPGPTDKDEPPPGKGPGEPGADEPPAPGKKSESDLNKPPEAYLDPEDADGLGQRTTGLETENPNATAELHEGAGEDKSTGGVDKAGVDKGAVDEMGADKSLNGHLKKAFADYIDGPQKPQKTAAQHSDEIRKAGADAERS